MTSPMIQYSDMLKESKSEFQYPNAFWTVTQRIGNSVAGLWIREEHKDLLAELNAHVRTMLQLPQAALRVACTVVTKGRQGKIDYTSAVKVSPHPSY